METLTDNTAEVSHRNRIWFFPDKFWKATKDMKPEEVSNLYAEVERLAEQHDVEALRKYPFVFVGDPYPKKRAS